MYKPPLAKVLIGLAIVTALITIQYCDVIPVHIKFQLRRFATGTNATKCRFTLFRSLLDCIPGRTVTVSDVDIINVTQTVLRSPMSTISRNILERYAEYRRIQRLDDFKQLHDSRFSVVELEGNQDNFTAGTVIKVRISLFNGYNQPITRGDDLLNIWLRNDAGTSSVAGYVVDHMNGTYTGHVMAFWAGNVTIKVTVTNTKEGIGLYTNYVHEHGSYKFVNATFSEKRRLEMTQCAPKPSKWLEKTYGGLCNLTKENYNISLFCGKPKYASCSKWDKYGWDDTLYYGKDTKKILQYKDVPLKKIKLTIYPSLKGDIDYPVPKTACKFLPPYSTWNSTVPSGFLYKGVYTNLLCRSTVTTSRGEYRACLKHRPLISIGDSTTRQWFLHLVDILAIRKSSRIPSHAAFHKFAIAENKTLGLHLEWQPHELPFYGSPGSNRREIKSVAYRIDQIPENSSAIVVIHWYAHIARCCDHMTFREHVRTAKEAVLRLLMRSPEVQVFIKGPHLITYPNALKPYAYVGMFVEQILLEEFYNLTYRVIYLDQWDMSVAMENVDIHPNKLLDEISLNNLINLACNNI